MESTGPCPHAATRSARFQGLSELQELSSPRKKNKQKTSKFMAPLLMLCEQFTGVKAQAHGAQSRCSAEG